MPASITGEIVIAEASYTYSVAGKSIFVSGHRGMVGSALVRRLEREPCRVVTADRRELDLVDQAAVNAWMLRVRPDVVIVSAAKVGGILANATAPADFLYLNLMIEANLISAAHRVGVDKLLFLGSSCIYPKFAPQPLVEDALLTGPLEPTKEWYAVAKIAGIKLCQAYRHQYGAHFNSAMPTNLYGPNDNFNPETSHVLPALMRKVHLAKISGAEIVQIWGSGTPRREFLHVDDLADALVHLLQFYDGEEHVNVGSGKDISIADLAVKIGKIVGYSGLFTGGFWRTRSDGERERSASMLVSLPHRTVQAPTRLPRLSPVAEASNIGLRPADEDRSPVFHFRAAHRRKMAASARDNCPRAIPA